MKYDNIKMQMNILINEKQNVCIYGTGLAAQIGKKALDRLSICCECFIDRDESKWRMVLDGKEIRDIKKVSKEQLILIMANPEYKIHERIEKEGFNRWMYMDPEILRVYEEGYFDRIKSKLRENRRLISEVYDMLGDERSRVVFENVLRHRLSNRLDLIEKVYDKNQYFGNDLIGKAEGNIVDCGAYTGDTLKRFINQRDIASKYQYYAFEAEKKNYDILVDYCERENIQTVKAYNIAVWDKQEELLFEGDENADRVSGKVVETQKNAKKIEANSLDNLLSDVPIDIIMMDIEGAEKRALNGAKKIIDRYHPDLAISAYHKLEHLWEIPLQIKKLDSNYKIYFRHHRWNLDDTICYGLCR